MADSKKKEIAPSKIFLYGIVVKNPILVQVIGLCPAVAASSSLYVALLLSAMITMMLLICEVFASAVLKPLSSWFRVAIYMIFGIMIVCPIMYYLDITGTKIVTDAGIYLPLMAANSIVALRCEKFAVKRSVSLSYCDALATGIGTSMVLILSGFLRELLGTGAVAGRVIFAEAPAPAITIPFGGFIILGFSAAFLKWFITNFLSEYSHDMTFKIKKASKHPAQKPTTAPQREKTKPKAFPAATTAVPSVSDSAASSPRNLPQTDFAVPEAKKGLADSFYSSLSDDLFGQEDLFADELSLPELEIADITDLIPEEKLAQLESLDLSFVPTDKNDEAERVIIPIDLDNPDQSSEGGDAQ